MTDPWGRPSQTKGKRPYEDTKGQAQSWDKPSQMITKIEWHPGELFPKVGFIVTNKPIDPDWVVRFATSVALPSSTSRKANALSAGRGFRASDSATTRSSCNCTRWPTTWPSSCATSHYQSLWPDWSLPSLQLKLIRIGAHVVRYARAIIFRFDEVVVTGPTVEAILAAILGLRASLSGVWLHPTETERKRQDESVYRAEEWQRRAWMKRVCGPTCPYSSILPMQALPKTQNA